MEKEKPRGMTVAEAGKLGGDTVKRKYGTEHYVAIGRKGGLATKKRGHDFYAEIGKKGGEVIKERAAKKKPAT